MSVGRGKVGELKLKLFGQTSNDSSQKLATQKELETLKTTVNVSAKAKQLEELFNSSMHKLEKAIQTNKISQEATRKFALKEDQELFQSKQAEFVSNIESRIKKDMQAFAVNIELQQKISATKYFELSFIYRAYEVCLEQDY